MIRTVKLSYTTVPQAVEIIAQWRKAQSVVIRTAYNRVREGKKDKEILDLLRVMPQGKLDSWLTLSSAIAGSGSDHSGGVESQTAVAIVLRGTRQEPW
jgi:hypothetical protein